MLNVVMIGAGSGGSLILPLLCHTEDINLMGVAEINPSAPGLEIARMWRIPVTQDYRELVARDTLDIIIDLTGNSSVAEDIDRLKKPGAEVFGGKMAKIVWNIIEERNRQLRSLVKQVSDHYGFGNIIGKSERMREVFQLMENIADTETTVLLQGETGTGKELVARAIHYSSSRKGKPFIAVNCAAFPPDLLESELFGHEKGSFTGATVQRKGMFELAHGGTFFLDEIGAGSMAVQLELLRVLQDQKFRRVGGAKSVEVDVRVIAATNEDLNEKIENGKFRRDLYYRLNVIPIRLPALRQRLEDLPELIEYFLKKFSLRHRRGEKAISPETLQILYRCPWPGNIRELENLVERLVVTCPESVITPKWLPEEYEQSAPGVSGIFPAVEPGIDTTLERMEREVIQRAIAHNQGRRKETAEQLGISRKVLWAKMKKYQLKPTRPQDKKRSI
jgi:transcriptional regulator with PAS, ATPase and Fis domain